MADDPTRSRKVSQLARCGGSHIVQQASSVAPATPDLEAEAEAMANVTRDVPWDQRQYASDAARDPPTRRGGSHIVPSASPMAPAPEAEPGATEATEYD